MDSIHSLENVKSKWANEIGKCCPDTTLVLVALKCDLRENDEAEGTGDEETNQKSFIAYQDGLEAAKEIQAKRYLGMETDCEISRSLV